MSSEPDCSEKLVFDSKQAAIKSMAAITWRHGSKLKAYRCTKCSLWHLATDYGND